MKSKCIVIFVLALQPCICQAVWAVEPTPAELKSVAQKEIRELVNVAQRFARRPDTITVAKIKLEFPGQYKALDCAFEDAACDYVNVDETSAVKLSNFSVANNSKRSAFGGLLVWQLPAIAPCLQRSELDGFLGQRGGSPEMPITQMSFDSDVSSTRYIVYKNLNNRYPGVAIGA